MNLPESHTVTGEPATDQARAFSIQLAIVAALVLVYWAIGVYWLPRGQRFLLAIGVPALAGVYLRARRRAPAEREWLTWLEGGHIAVLKTWGWAFTFMVLPVAFTAPVKAPAAVLAVLGTFCFLAIWAIHRYPAMSDPLLDTDIGWRPLAASSAGYGLLFGAVLSVMVAVPIGFVAVHLVMTGKHPLEAARIWLTASAGYLLGGLFGGIVVGVLAPLTRWPLGLMLMGVPLTTSIYLAVWLTVSLVDTTFAEYSWTSLTLMAASIGMLGGPISGILLRKVLL